ncbi:MAG: ATP-binding protein [Rikenellaceae bacterium]
MIIEFVARNFRSIKDPAILSFESNSSKQKQENIFAAAYGEKGCSHNLTKTIAIYGANASGKSSVIIAFYALWKLVTSSHQNSIGRKISPYEPFSLDAESAYGATRFELVFILDGTKFKLEVEYTQTKILLERLYTFKTTQPTLLYQRVDSGEAIHKVEFKRELSVEGVKREVIENQLFLSKFNLEAHSVLTPICAYFKSIDVELSSQGSRTKALNEKIAAEILLDKSGSLKRKLIRLIDAADMSIKDIVVKKREVSDFVFPEDFPEELKSSIIKKNSTTVNFIHALYAQGRETGTTQIALEDQSLGTQLLFGLGARILKKLDSGGILFYDEFDTSLHPRLSRLLVTLFNSRMGNPKNAQLIITTHEPSILEKNLLRSDQIWFVEKNEQGASELFSAQDFDGVREDVPFDKWYQANKFGATPSIGDVEHIFQDEDATSQTTT